MKWPKFICFIGIDGSGKTTLAKAFVKFAKGKGVDYHYVWANNQPILIAPLRKLWRLIFFRGKDMFTDYEDYNKTKKQVARKSRILYRLYRFVHTVDYMLWIMLRVKIPLLLGRRIVCDRYVYDVAVSLSILLDYNFQQTEKLINTYLKYVPTPDAVFLIDVPEEVAFERKNDVPSLSYLKERRVIYSELGQHYQMFYLDGTMDVEKLIQEVWQHAEEEIECTRTSV